MEAVVFRLMLIYARLAPLAAGEHRVVASGRRGGPLAGLDPHAGRRSGPRDPLVVGERSDQSRRRPARAGGAGILPDIGAAPAPLGEVFTPDPAHHARYLAALERHQHLDERV
jgi:hypothetical protein